MAQDPPKLKTQRQLDPGERPRIKRVVAWDARRRWIYVTVALVCVVVCAALFFLLRPQAPANKKDKSVPVVVATAQSGSLPMETKSIGNVLPFSVINVTPQVSGQLAQVYITQGQMVRKGQVMFQIDPRSYEAAVAQARGNVAKDQGQVAMAVSNRNKDIATVGQLQANLRKDMSSLTYAQREMQRYNNLYKQGAVSLEQSDQMATNAAAAQSAIEADKKAIENARAVMASDLGQIASMKGTLEADQALLSTAELQLSWTKIVAPIDGRTGSFNVYPGNIVTANNSAAPLVTIEQIQPIYIQFTLPEQNLDEIRRSLTDGTLQVQALIEGKKTNSVGGKVSFLESTVNTTSGTITMRAIFANEAQSLFPGQFVDVVVTMPPGASTVVVPSTAVVVSQTGNSVYVLRQNQTVDFVNVTVARTFGELTAITSGLKPGDLVVVDGQLQLTPGAHVHVVPANLMQQAAAGARSGRGQRHGGRSGGNGNASSDNGGNAGSGGSGNGNASNDNSGNGGGGHHGHGHRSQ